MTRRTVILLAIAAATLIAAMVVAGIVLVRGGRAPQVHLVPDGYTGWVSVDYSVKSAPPLPVEDGHQVFRYDSNGRLETSTEYDERWPVWGTERYYYVSGEARRSLSQSLSGFDGRIWGAYTQSHIVRKIGRTKIRKDVSTGFFVGTEEDFVAAPTPPDVPAGLAQPPPP